VVYRPLYWLLISAAFVSGIWAQQGLEVGEKVGTIHLISPEGFPVEMDNYGERRATVVLFLSTRDEGTASEAEAIVALNHKHHEHHRVLFVGVFSEPGIKAKEVRAFCQTHGFNFPVYLDPDLKVARQFGARVTPEMFLLDSQGKLLYRGSEQGITGALTAFQAGSAIPPSELKVQGTELGKMLAPPPIGDPFASIDFSSELIFTKITGYPVHHCSSITEAPNGDLLVTWYGGSYESSDDQVLFLSRRAKGSRDWSKPTIIVRSPGKPPGNAILFTDGSGKVWLLWGRMDGRQPMMRGTGWDHCQLFSRTSRDNGATWSGDKPFFGNTMGWLPRNLSIWGSDGSLIVPISDELHGNGVDLSFFVSTRDNGATWSQSGIMRGGEQPTIIQRADGTFVAFLRVRPRIVAAESHDGGKTWSTPTATQWMNPDSGISMRRLSNGHVILVFNNQDNARTPLHIVRSTDEARTWEKPLILETNPGEYSYPSVLQTKDGKIHIIYTFRRYSIKHVEMNEDWLTRFERPD
jgi:predicted neuraminidase/peroxiredoxin